MIVSGVLSCSQRPLTGAAPMKQISASGSDRTLDLTKISNSRLCLKQDPTSGKLGSTRSSARNSS
jgi:hypothetical protein